MAGASLDLHIAKIQQMAKETVEEGGYVPALLAITNAGLVSIEDLGGWLEYSSWEQMETILSDTLRRINASAYLLISESTIVPMTYVGKKDKDIPLDDMEPIVAIVGVERQHPARMWQAHIKDSPSGRTLDEWKEEHLTLERPMPNNW